MFLANWVGRVELKERRLEGIINQLGNWWQHTSQLNKFQRIEVDYLHWQSEERALQL